MRRGNVSFVLIDRQGKQLTDRAVPRYEDGKGVELPVDMYIVHESAPDRARIDMDKTFMVRCVGHNGNHYIQPKKATCAHGGAWPH